MPEPEPTVAETAALSHDPGAMLDAPSAPAVPEPPPGLVARLVRRVLSLLPWASLILSTVSAVMMERSKDEARLVAAIAASSWVTMLAVSFVMGYVEQKVQAGWVKSVARFSMTALAQNVLQLCLYFAFPLYLFSAAFTFPQVAFLLAMIVAGVIITWDPFCERALESPLLRSVLTAFISFTAMAAVLPMVGISQGVSLWVAALMVAVFAPLVRWMELGRARVPVQTILVSVLLPVALFFDLATAVPPAPLRAVELGIGTGVESRALVGEADHFETPPSKMVCFSAIAAPAGLREQLQHVWSHDGRTFAPIALEVRGGREEGFRTWTRRSLGKNPSGRWTCEVQTRFGQVLGRTSATVR